MSSGMSGGMKGDAGSQEDTRDEYKTGTKSGTSDKDTKITFDDVSKAALDEALTSQEFSKASAIRDARSLSEATMKTLLEKQAPGLATAGKATGGYDSTTQAQLQNDLLARTGAAGQQVLLDSILKYSAAKQGAITAATGAVGATAGKKESIIDTSKAADTEQEQKRMDKINFEGKGGTVICTQLYRDGHLPKAVYRADQQYVDKHFSLATINGYRFWAVPFVYAMRANKYVYAVGKYFGVRWSYHCASHYMEDATVKRNLLSEVIIYLVVPVCFILGSILPEVKYYKLWAGS